MAYLELQAAIQDCKEKLDKLNQSLANRPNIFNSFRGLLKKIWCIVVFFQPVLRKKQKNRQNNTAINNQPSEADIDNQILAVLLARDKIEKLVTDTPSIHIDNSQEIIKLDRNLKRSAESGNWAEKANSWHKSLGRSEKFWWWYSQHLQQPRFKVKNLLLDLFNLAVFAFAFALFINTTTRILNATNLFRDSLNLTGIFALAIQSILAIVAGRNSPLVPKEKLEQFVEYISFPSHKKRFITLFITFLFLLSTLTVYIVILPYWSSQSYNKGIEQYRKGSYARAETDFDFAVKLNPNNSRAQNRLGEVYEDQGQDKESIYAYEIAAAQDHPTGYINLARNYILQGRSATEGLKKQYFWDATTSINRACNLEIGLGCNEYDDYCDQQLSALNESKENCYNSHMVMGWAYWEIFQTQQPNDLSIKSIEQTFNNAIKFLTFAIEYSERKGNFASLKETTSMGAYCLYAEIVDYALSLNENDLERLNLDREKVQEEGRKFWQKCYVSLETKYRRFLLRPYEIDWFDKAKLGN